VLKEDFVKSHGLGNDYVVVDAARFGVALTPARVRLLCDRNLGLGSDGILEVSAGGGAEGGEGGGPGPRRLFVKIWNPDGSEAERSGNGLRIAAKFFREHGYIDDDAFVLETVAGPVRAELVRDPASSRVGAVRLEMGRATLDRARTSLDVGGRALDVTVVSVGNPHCVVFGEPLSRERLFALGPAIECHAAFPNRINVQLAAPLSRTRVRALIWERGAGHTLASGTSSCAVAAACYDRGLVDGAVTIEMEGGTLDVGVASDLSIVMKGPVEEVYVGTMSPDLRARLDATA
jgi:diaminopimelate epimerase